MKKLISIEILRGLAATLVVIVHVMAETQFRSQGSSLLNFYNLQHFGLVGVDIFFVISGFIMVLIHGNDFLKPKGSLIFLKKRFLRIAPLYWFFTIIASFFLIAMPDFSSRGLTFDFVHFLMSLAFIPWNNSAGTIFPVLGVGWTLNYEMYFYLLFAICLMFNRKFFLLILSTFFIGGIIFSTNTSINIPILKMIGSPLLLEFLGGVFIGWLYKKNILIKNYYLLLIISLFLLISNVFFHFESSYKFIYFGLPSALLLYSLISLEKSSNIFESISPKVIKPLLIVGSSSYSIYLSHPFILKAVYRFLPVRFVSDYPDVLIFCVSIITVLFGIFIYYIIEIPLINYTKNVFFYKSKTINISEKNRNKNEIPQMVVFSKKK